MGRLPVLAAGAIFLVGSVACAGSDASPSVTGDGLTAARPIAGDAAKGTSKSAPGGTRAPAPRATGKGRHSGTSVAGGGGPRQTNARPRAGKPGAAGPLAVTVEDPPSDAEGDVPGFIEVIGAAVRATGGELTMGITVAEAIPDKLTPGEAAMFAFDVETSQEKFTVVAQLDHNGIAATFNAGDETTPLEHEVLADELRISVPWRLLGGDRPSFEWTAGTVLMQITADGVSARGGDSADAASFPPPATQDDLDEGR